MQEWTNCVSLASFWEPKKIAFSAWVEHTPFAFWLVESSRPRRIVELGTFQGHSFFVFCQAVKTLQLGTEVVGIDHWQGDSHTGAYDGETMYRDVLARTMEHYREFARVVRASFDDALSEFEDGSIDLLHIDGRHLYEDVKHDFETWRPKLSDRAIVLFHDTQVKEHRFGVWQFWAELSGHHKFEFEHGYGLGIAKVGRTPLPAVDPLFSASAETAAAVRAIYSRLGATFQDRLRCDQLAAELAKIRSSPRALIRALRKVMLGQRWTT